MIGAHSMVSRAPGSPTSTGHAPWLTQAVVWAARCGGGSTSDANAPPRTRRRAWVEAKLWICAAARSPAPSCAVVFSISTRSRHARSPIASAAALMPPLSRCHARVIAPSRSAPAGMSIRARLRERSTGAGSSTTSRSRASCQARYSSPSMVSRSTERPAGSRSVRSTICRKRTVTSTVVSPSPSSRHSVRIRHASSGCPGSLQARGNTPPNVQRRWFLGAERL
jgi:hypothetical protein